MYLAQKVQWCRYAPNLGFAIAILGWKREQGPFKREYRGSRIEHRGSTGAQLAKSRIMRAVSNTGASAAATDIQSFSMHAHAHSPSPS